MLKRPSLRGIGSVVARRPVLEKPCLRAEAGDEEVVLARYRLSSSEAVARAASGVVSEAQLAHVFVS